MIELDANGNIPRQDERCRIYRVAGVKDGLAWEGFNIWTGGVFPSQANIEAYPTFRGWVTEEIRGTDVSTEPVDALPLPGPGESQMRIAVVDSPHGPYFDTWVPARRQTQAHMAQGPSFLRWVSDTLTFPVTAPTSQELAAAQETAAPKTPRERKQAITSVDVVLLTLEGGKLHTVLVERDHEPFTGKLALPGGYVHTEVDADSRAAARRTLEKKTGIKSPYLEQLYTFSGPDRDPRGWSFSVTYYALVSAETLAARLGESKGVHVVPVDAVPELAFDHNEILDFAMKRLRDKSSYSALPCYLLPKEFTLSELQTTYEMVMGSRLNKSSFRRKFDDMGFLEPLEGQFRTGKHRPAQLYRLRRDKSLTLFDRTV
jgi:8-oxo-dGTP diphosphatase